MKNNIKEFLDIELENRNSETELSYEKPDPLIIVQRFKDERVALISALFAYGKASQIVKFLDSLDFSLLDSDDEVKIQKQLSDKYYRFQKNEDVIAIFIALNRITKSGKTLEDIFLKGYQKDNSVLAGIGELISEIQNIYPHNSRGYQFLLGKIPNIAKPRTSSPYKRWNLLLRWLVRKDNLDIGIWKNVNKKDLLIPLDTHTFNISQKLGLLSRKTYDLQAVIELTAKLKEFDKNDPVKYDFAIYRIGQEKMI